MGKYTSGPWAWRGEPGNSELHGAKGCVLGYATYEGMWLSYDADAEGRAANARLIAASPDLLEAIEDRAMHAAIDAGLGVSEWMAFLTDKEAAAIAKATGESP